MMWGTSTTQSLPRADWTLIDISRKFQFSYRQYAKQSKTNKKRCCAFHRSSLMMWRTSTTQSSPRTQFSYLQYATKTNKQKTVLCIPPFVPDDVRNLNDPELTESRLNTHRYLPKIPVLISSICETIKNKQKTVLCVPPFVPDDVKNLNDPELTKNRLRTHRYLPENLKNDTLVQSYL